jgi:misacylated tRNA(Ala) deacylase
MTEPGASPPATVRRYMDDDDCLAVEARLLAQRGRALAFDQTCFYPGGGGQPPDTGAVTLAGRAPIHIASASADAAGVIWHAAAEDLPELAVGAPAALAVDRERRLALTRYHTVLHVLNTLVLRDYGGWITGVQIGADYSRIDFKLDQLTPELCADLERKVNAVLAAGHPLRAFTISEAEFRSRADLLRTLDVRPPVVGGRVRVVAIEGFDEQACGGTHVHTTAEVGRFSITRTENKGRQNKRLYVRLEPPA